MDITTDLHAKATRFRQMHHRPEILVLPNPWDVGTARLLADLGFEALATTSAGLAHSLGRPDGSAGRLKTLEHAAAIAAATELPLSADLENCFADEPAGVAATVAAASATGIVGCSIEDATGRAEDPIYDFDRAVARVAAAVASAAAAPFPFTLTARAENFLHGRPDLKDTIARLQAFAEAGADVVYAPGITSIDDVARIVAAVAVPVNVLAMPGMTVSQLQDAGVARVSVGSGLSRSALGSFHADAAQLIADGTFGYHAADRPQADYDGIFSGWGE